MGATQEYRTGRHVVYQLHVHLVFVPRYRRKVFDADALKRLRIIFGAVSGDFEAELTQFNGEPDHVHLLVNYPPKVAVARLVNSLKGVSARRLRQERPDISRRYWRGGLWSASYFAASCGGAPISILRQYIESQRTPN
jgi:putative transposase